MKLLERIKPKDKSGIINYVVLLLIIAEMIFTLVPSIHFVAEKESFDYNTNEIVSERIESLTSLQNYLWLPSSGNNKLNGNFTEQLKDEHFQNSGYTEAEASSFINNITLFPVLLTVASIVILIVCIAFGGNLASTILSVIWGIVGVLACFVNNTLFKGQSTYMVQMVLILVITVVAIGNVVLTYMPKANKESEENKIAA